MYANVEKTVCVFFLCTHTFSLSLFWNTQLCCIALSAGKRVNSTENPYVFLFVVCIGMPFVVWMQMLNQRKQYYCVNVIAFVSGCFDISDLQLLLSPAGSTYRKFSKNNVVTGAKSIGILYGLHLLSDTQICWQKTFMLNYYGNKRVIRVLVIFFCMKTMEPFKIDKSKIYLNFA